MDLHGLDLTLRGKNIETATEECYNKKIKNLKVITGQGEMSKEFLGWVQRRPICYLRLEIPTTIKVHGQYN